MLRLPSARWMLITAALSIMLGVSGCGHKDDGHAEGPGATTVSAKAVEELQKAVSLSVTFTPGEKDGDTVLTLRLVNQSSSRELHVGDDILACGMDWYSHGKNGYQTAILAKSAQKSWRPERQLMFCNGADALVGYMNDTMAYMLFGCSGQGITMVNGSSCGQWPESLKPQGELSIHSTLATRKRAEYGWVASPVLSSDTGARCRVLCEVGKDKTNTRYVPLTIPHLMQVIGDGELPLAVRRWATVWLGGINTQGARTQTLQILHAGDQQLDIRRAAVATMAVYGTPTSLAEVNKLVWDMSAPKELRLYGMWALTWTDHPEAKPLIAKAANHPDPEIREESRRATSE